MGNGNTRQRGTYSAHVDTSDEHGQSLRSHSARGLDVSRGDAGAYPGGGATSSLRHTASDLGHTAGGGGARTVHVVCPRCRATLVPPAPVFRCPCGQTMTYSVTGDAAASRGGMRYMRMPAPGGDSAAAMQARVLEERINALLRTLPPSDPQAQLLTQLLRRLPRNPDGSISLEAAARLQERLERLNGVSQDMIEMLPLHKWTAPKTAAAAAEEQMQCMVCLCEYEEGEDIRTLPCLHLFHKDCVDKWLGSNRTCPICKTDVTTVPGLEQVMRESAAAAERALASSPATTDAGAVAAAAPASSAASAAGVVAAAPASASGGGYGASAGGGLGAVAPGAGAPSAAAAAGSVL